MYLDYQEYQEMGGTLIDTAFLPLERKAEYLINAQASGRCGHRISNFDEIPEAIKTCVYELVSFLSVNNATGGKQIASESQSQGGVSESISYVVKTSADVEKDCDSIIHDVFFGAGLGHLLYKGGCI